MYQYRSGSCVLDYAAELRDLKVGRQDGDRNIEITQAGAFGSPFLRCCALTRFAQIDNAGKAHRFELRDRAVLERACGRDLRRQAIVTYGELSTLIAEGDLRRA